MALTAAVNLETSQFDVTNVFINSSWTRRSISHTLKAFVNVDTACFCLEPCTAYARHRACGTKRSPKPLLSMGMKPAGDEPCLMVNDWLIVFFFVDDVVALHHHTGNVLGCERRDAAFSTSLLDTQRFH
jgi:hypothetical protein